MLKHCPPIPEKAVNAAEFLVARILTYFETLKIEEFKIDCMTANNEFFFKQKYYSIILHSELYFYRAMAFVPKSRQLCSPIWLR